MMILAACETSFFSTPFQFFGLLLVLLLWFLIGLVLAWIVFDRKGQIGELLGSQRHSNQRLVGLQGGDLAAPEVAVADTTVDLQKDIPDVAGTLPDVDVKAGLDADLSADPVQVDVPSAAPKLDVDAPASDATAPAASAAVDVPEASFEYDSSPRSSGEYDAVVNRAFAGEDVNVNPDLGVLYGAKPEQADDLQMIRGVGSVLEGKLHENGVYRFKQIAAWDQHNINAFSETLNTFPDRVERDAWVPQARELADMAEKENAESYVAPTLVDHKAKLANEFRGEDARADVNLGVVYESAPDVQDELQEINGVGPQLEEKLHDFGVYRFRQIANWSDHNVTEFSDRLDTFKDRIERDKWIPQARRMHDRKYKAASRWGSASPSLAEYDALGRELFPGGDVKADADLGVLFASKPNNQDDLSVLPGMDAATQKKLNEMGIYRASQIANWSDANVQAFSAKLNVSEDVLLAWGRRADRGLPALAVKQPAASKTGSQEDDHDEEGCNEKSCDEEASSQKSRCQKNTSEEGRRIDCRKQVHLQSHAEGQTKSQTEGEAKSQTQSQVHAEGPANRTRRPRRRSGIPHQHRRGDRGGCREAVQRRIGADR